MLPVFKEMVLEMTFIYDENKNRILKKVKIFSIIIEFLNIGSV